MYKQSSLYKELARIENVIEQNGDLSYGDIAFLGDFQTEIKEWFPDSIRLWETAGIPEQEWNEKEV